mgnify:CR=1
MIYKRDHLFESESLYAIYSIYTFFGSKVFRKITVLTSITVPVGLIACLMRIHHKLAQTDKAVQQTTAQQSPGYLLVVIYWYSSSVQNFHR